MSSDKANTVLIVEDDLALQKQIKWSLDQFESVTADDRQSAMVQLRRFVPAVVTMDLGLPPDADSVSEGFKLLEQILAAEPDTKVIVLTGQNGQANALKAIAMGAYDFLAKPFEPEVLALTVERAFRLAELQAENRRLQSMQTPDALAGLITKDPGMLRVCRTIEKVASSNVTVMLLGESGTGKEVLARGLHQSSGRKANKFVAINCAAIPDNLLESELFGYEKGAFTGAVKTTVGKIETAHGGTLMLDEIGDIPPAVQTKLLRVLQDGVIRPVGAGKSMRADARIIAVTNQNLEAKIKDGTFREDLFYRLNVLGVQTPALREHKEDIPLLAAYFLAQACSEMGVEPKHLSPEATAGLSLREWPGNIRELQNFMRRMAVFADGPEVKPHHLRTGAGRRSSTAPASPYKEAKLELVENFTRQYLSDLLRSTGGNISETARISGLGRVSLQKILRRIDLDADVFRRG